MAIPRGNQNKCIRNGKMISEIHQWCFALAIWGLMMWLIPQQIWFIVGLVLGAAAVLLLCRFGVWYFDVFLEGRYGE